MSPIRPSEKARYPKDWKAIGAEVRARAGDRCECAGECGREHPGRCLEHNGHPAYSFNGKVVLTIAHLDHTPENNGRPGARPNLKAMCQRCHLRYDAPHHAKNAAQSKDKE